MCILGAIPRLARLPAAIIAKSAGRVADDLTTLRQAGRRLPHGENDAVRHSLRPIVSCAIRQYYGHTVRAIPRSRRHRGHLAMKYNAQSASSAPRIAPMPAPNARRWEISGFVDRLPLACRDIDSLTM